MSYGIYQNLTPTPTPTKPIQGSSHEGREVGSVNTETSGVSCDV